MADKHAGTDSHFQEKVIIPNDKSKGKDFLTHMFSSSLFRAAVGLIGLGLLAHFGVLDRLLGMFR